MLVSADVSERQNFHIQLHPEHNKSLQNYKARLNASICFDKYVS